MKVLNYSGYHLWIHPFQITGFAWWEQEHKYRRLPVVETGVIRDILDELADHTSGGQIRFLTSSTKLVIRVELFEASTAEHMPATAVNGFDCYLGLPGSQKYVGTTSFALDEDHYESALFKDIEPGLHGVTLNFPLFQGVYSVGIGLDVDAVVEAYPPYDHAEKVVLYGTSITQGGCASRPGMAYSNILSRRFNQQFINLGFSGNGKGDPEIARFISQIAGINCIILDYDTNCVTVEDLMHTMPEFIRILRSRYAEVPILVLSRIPFAFEHVKSSSYQDRLARMTFQREWVQTLQQQGDHAISFYNGADLLGEVWNESSVDGVHQTDLGFMQIANGLTPILKEILQSKHLKQI